MIKKIEPVISGLAFFLELLEHGIYGIHREWLYPASLMNRYVPGIMPKNATLFLPTNPAPRSKYWPFEDINLLPYKLVPVS